MHFYRRLFANKQRPILLTCVSFPLPIPPALCSFKSDHVSCLTLFSVSPACMDSCEQAPVGICSPPSSPASPSHIIPTNPLFPFPPRAVRVSFPCLCLIQAVLLFQILLFTWRPLHCCHLLGVLSHKLLKLLWALISPL